jgi:metallo-beta-lactamase family protein
MPKLTFLGAAGTVTGSKYLVEAEGKRLLVDCGLFQGLKELRLRNWNPLPEKPVSFDWCVLTHAHLDHTGYLPRLVREGFNGPIYADAATIELCNILLPDSAHLQEEDAEKAGRAGYSKHAKPLPLYSRDDVAPVLKALREIPRAVPFTISPQFTVRPHDAGHILGSASLELTITENGKKMVVLFSGDVGRYGQPILKDPEAPRRRAATCCCANPRTETATILRIRRKMRSRTS